MRIAIPQWEQRVSPILDDAGSLVLVDTEEGGPEQPSVVPLTGVAPLDRAGFLQRLGVDFVICGAISRQLQLLLDAAGIEVVANTCGPVEHIVRDFLNGCCGEQRSRRRIRHGGRGCAKKHGNKTDSTTGRDTGMAERSHKR